MVGGRGRVDGESQTGNRVGNRARLFVPLRLARGGGKVGGAELLYMREADLGERDARLVAERKPGSNDSYLDRSVLPTTERDLLCSPANPAFVGTLEADASAHYGT